MLAETDYDVERTFVAAAVQTASSALSRLTGGALHDGVVLASETPRSNWPDPADLRGWLVFYTETGYFEAQTFSILSASYLDQFGTIHGSAVLLPPRTRTSSAEILDATRDAIGRYVPGTIPTTPASLSESFGTIQYSRKIGQRALDVPDYQD